jgi:hypothetical protein
LILQTVDIQHQQRFGYAQVRITSIGEQMWHELHEGIINDHKSRVEAPSERSA